MLEIVDDAGNIVRDINGKPAIATITEEAEAGGVASVSIVIGHLLLPGSRGSFLGLLDPVTTIPAGSDMLTFSGGVAFGLCSASDPAHAVDCAPVVDGIPVRGIPNILETGQPQEVATFPSPIGNGNIHVIVQSSLESVPEPSTVALLAAGLGCLSVVRRRNRLLRKSSAPTPR
jgi:hypothetical protein